MDYAQLLFAYHVNKDAEKRLAQDYSHALTAQEFEVAMDEAVRDIIGTIETTARRIEMLSNRD